jgi:hypothetical protein
MAAEVTLAAVVVNLAGAPPPLVRPGSEYTCDEVRQKRACCVPTGGARKAGSLTRALDSRAQHLLSFEELAAKHCTRVNGAEPQKSRGLTHAQAAERLATLGLNVLTPPRQTPLLLQFLLKVRRRHGRVCDAGVTLARRSRARAPAPAVRGGRRQRWRGARRGAAGATRAPARRAPARRAQRTSDGLLRARARRTPPHAPAVPPCALSQPLPSAKPHAPRVSPPALCTVRLTRARTCPPRRPQFTDKFMVLLILAGVLAHIAYA